MYQHRRMQMTLLRTTNYKPFMKFIRRLETAYGVQMKHFGEGTNFSFAYTACLGGEQVKLTGQLNVTSWVCPI